MMLSTLFLFIASSDRLHHFTHDLLFCASVALVYVRRDCLVAKYLTSRLVTPVCASIFVKSFSKTLSRCSYYDQYLCELSSPPTYMIFPEEPP